MKKETKQTATGKKRKAIPKKTRFEVFKRDQFTCQYCGRKSPDVVLNVDHIKPVASGGTNGITNLITSCFDCNSGKGKRELSDNTIAVKQRKELEIQQERLNQIKLMADWHISLLTADEASIDAVSDLIHAITNSSVSDYGRKNLARWIKKYDLGAVLASVTDSYNQYYHDDDDSWSKAFNMIPKISAIKMLPVWKQEALKYGRFAANNYSDWEASKLFSKLLKDYPEYLKDLDFKELYRYGMGMTEYYETVRDAFFAIDTKGGW